MQLDTLRALFTSLQPSDMQTVLKAIEPKVTANINQELIKDFTRDEVELALKHMEPFEGIGPGRYASNLFSILLVCGG